MLKNFEKSLLNLKNGSVQVSATNAYLQAGQAEVEILFSNGSKLEAAYWRIVKDGKAVISSFDHQQKYGLPAPLDAIQELQNQLDHKVVTEALLDKETGDLSFNSPRTSSCRCSTSPAMRFGTSASLTAPKNTPTM
jgi:hypothetical protein